MLLSKGTYASYENRVYLAGAVNIGKSTLASVLIGEEIPKDWKSTDGLIIHFGRNGIDLDEKKMIPLKKGSAGHDIFAKVLRGNPEIKRPGSQNAFSSCKPSVVDTELIYNSEIDHSVETAQEESTGLELSIQEDMLKEILKGKYKMNIAPSDLVDFGGQRSFDMTHQLFIQCKGAFVLMFDGRYGLYDALDAYKPKLITTASIITHWIDSILTYCVDESVDEHHLPKILFAATHADWYTKDNIEKRKAMFIEELTKMFSSNDLQEHIIYNTLFFFDATNKDDPEIQQLTNQLVDIAFKQPSWGQQMPVAWIPLELQISNMKIARINFVKKSDLQGFNVQNEDFVLTDSQFEDFLKVQHSLGKLSYFGEYGIDKFIIIQPSALVNVLRSFVTDEFFWPKGEDVKDILPNLCHSRMIRRQDLYKLWEQKHFKTLVPTEDLRKFLIEVLIHLDILIEQKRFSEADGSADSFLVPCMIKEEAPDSFLHSEETDEKTICLSYCLKKSSVPAALFFKLIGSALNLLPIKEKDGRPCLYYKAAVLSVDDDNECRLHMEGNRILVNLINKTSRLQISPDIAASIQECLTLTLTKVLHFYYTCMGKDIKQVDILKMFETEVGVPCGEGFCFIPINEAMKEKTWTCENETVHTTDLLLNWMLDKTIGKDECPPDCCGIPTTVLFESPSEKHLMRLASVLDITMFHDFFLHLGMETKDWHNIQYLYWQPVDAMFMALMAWRDKGSMVTFKKILDAQEKVEDNQHHLCQVLKEQSGLPEIAGFGFEDTPSESFLSGLPNKLGCCVLPLGIELGLRIADIESVFVRHQKHLYSQVYEVLKIWKQKTPENTYSNLMLAIQRVRGKQFLKRNFGCDD